MTARSPDNPRRVVGAFSAWLIGVVVNVTPQPLGSLHSAMRARDVRSKDALRSDHPIDVRPTDFWQAARFSVQP